MRTGGRLNSRDEYYVVDKKLKIIEKFKYIWTAKRFISNHNKDFFNELEVLPKEVYEYQKKEREDRK